MATNDATRRVNLWLSNDYNTYQEMVSLANDAEDQEELAENIKNFVEENNPLASDSGMYAELLNNALSEVDYNELASDFWEDRDEDEEEEDTEED